jgi:hypothetical protein
MCRPLRFPRQTVHSYARYFLFACFPLVVFGLEPGRRDKVYSPDAQFSLIESSIAPGSRNTREDPDAMALPLKSYNCACTMLKARLTVQAPISFLENFEFLEEYEEDNNGRMLKVENSGQEKPTPTDIAELEAEKLKPDLLNCNCHKKEPGISLSLDKLA